MSRHQACFFLSTLASLCRNVRPFLRGDVIQNSSTGPLGCILTSHCHGGSGRLRPGKARPEFFIGDRKESDSPVGSVEKWDVALEWGHTLTHSS